MAELNCSPVGCATLRTVSITAFAALAAELWPRALMIAAPRCWTLVMNSPSSHASSPMTSGAGRAPIVACHASGNWVDEWLPQIARSRTSRTGTPAFLASCERPRLSSSMVMANHRSFGMPWRAAAVEPMSAFVLHGLPTTSTRQSSAASCAIASPWPVKIPPLIPSRSLRSMPSLRGTAPTRSAQLAPRNASSVSAVHTIDSSSGNAQSSSSICTPVERRERRLELEEPEVDRGVVSEGLPGGDPEEQRVADLSGGAGDGHGDGRVGHRSPVIGIGRECNAALPVRRRRATVRRRARRPSRRWQRPSSRNAMRGNHAWMSERATQAWSLDSKSIRTDASGSVAWARKTAVTAFAGAE